MSEQVRTIRCTRSGGFVGARRSAEVDLASLSPDEARELERLVAEADLPALEAAAPPADAPGPGADRFQYEVDIATDRGRRSVRVGEADAKPPLKALIDRVMELGRRPR